MSPGHHKRPPPDIDPEDWVEARRKHRQNLSEVARSRWEEHGEDARLDYLEQIRDALESEGFKSTLLQWRHKGHAFGLVKDLGKMQIHVRVYDDGVVDAELEIHKRYLEHLWSPRPSAHAEVQEILKKHGLDTELVNEQYLPQVGPLRERFPDRVTKVTHVAAGAVITVGGAVAYSLARMRLKKKMRMPWDEEEE